MQGEMSSKFGIVDYCVFGGMLILSGGIGLYTSCRGNKSPEEFLMGNRSFKPIPIAMSLLTSYVSAISLLGFSGEIYAYGSQLILFVIGITFGILFASTFILPVIYPLKLTSVNEYIELRFKSKKLQQVVSILASLQGLLYMGVCLYAPTIALVSVTHLSYLTYIFLLGILCTIYSSFGGIRAVVWTDVFQLSVMLLGLLIVCITGFIQNGGLIRTLYIASEGGRMDVFNMDPSPYVRHSFWNVIGFGFFFYSALYSVAQINMQRMCSVKSIDDARSVLKYNIFGMILIYTLIFCAGIVAYVAYAGCDPMALGFIKKKEEILSMFITDRMSFIPGLSGMFVATIIGGTMSSLSSVINSVVGMVWKDLCLKTSFFSDSSARFATLSNKILSLIIGCLIIGIALMVSKGKGLLQIAFVITSATTSPIYGVFLIGFFFPKCNIKGVWTGFITSVVFVGWLSIGAQFFYTRNDPMLSQEIDKCETFLDQGKVEKTTSLFNETIYETPLEELYQPLGYLYEISYTLYCFIATILCILVALLVSWLTGNQSVDELSPKYITPCLRKFYWSREDLDTFQDTENLITSFNGKVTHRPSEGSQDYEKMLNITINKNSTL